MVDIKEEQGKSTTTLVLETIAGLMTAAFAFVAALAWNQAIQDAVKKYLSAGDGLTGEFIYAIIITIIAVIAIIYIGRVLAKYKAVDARRK
jgi:hypothetical protein